MIHPIVKEMHYKDMTLARWCRENGESYSSAVAYLQGRLHGKVSKRITRKLREGGYSGDTPRR